MIALVSFSTLSACDTCDQKRQNRRFYRVVERWYLWNDSIPDIDPQSYDSSQAMIDAIRYEEDGQVVDRWSYVGDLEALDRYFEESERFGFGYFLLYDAKDELRVAYTDPNGPADDAGVVRGDTILEISGEDIETIRRENLWDDVLGPDEEGFVVPFTIRDRQGEVSEVEIRKGTVSFQTVPVSKVIEQDGARVGYVYFGAFVQKSVDELDQAFTSLKDEMIDSLVVDVRYNGGGLVSTAQYLASIIAPHEFEDELFLEFSYNRDRESNDSAVKLTREDASVQVRDVVFITGAGTASASESVIMGLDSYINVTQVGERTVGKPVAANSWDSCEESLNLITARLTYAQGPGEYYRGLEPDCAATDDLDRQLGDPEEKRLAAALSALAGRGCPQVEVPAPAKGIRPASASLPGSLRPIVLPFAQNDVDLLFDDLGCAEGRMLD